MKTITKMLAIVISSFIATVLAIDESLDSQNSYLQQQDYDYVLHATCKQCDPQVKKQKVDFSEIATNWLPVQSLDEKLKKQLPDFICGAYVEPQQPQFIETANDKILLRASKANIDNKKNIALSGSVELAYKDIYVKCSSANISQSKKHYYLQDNIQLCRPGLLITAATATLEAETKTAMLTDSDFILYDSNAHGHADKIYIDTQGNLQLTQAFYTKCPPNSNLWKISAKKIVVNYKKKTLKATNAKFKFHNRTIFWLPKLTFSMDESQRQTGLLFPEINFNSVNNFNILIPFYWNINSNYKATIAVRYLQNQSWLAENDFSYTTSFLGSENKGSIKLHWIMNENISKHKSYYINWQNNSLIAENLTINIDYQHLGNADFFKHLSVDKVSTKYLPQNIACNWFVASNNDRDKLTADLIIAKIQKLDPNFISAYNKYPSVFLTYNKQPNNNIELTTNIEYSNFINTNKPTSSINRAYDYALISADATRIFANLKACYYKKHKSFFWQPQITTTYLSHRINNPNKHKVIADLSSAYDNFNLYDYSTNVTTVAPSFSITTGLELARTIKLAGNNWESIFEPKLKYSFTPNLSRQHMHPVLDTEEVKLNSYANLWHESRFSGRDRIADQNQLTIGFSNKLTSANNTILRFSVGEIFYFNDRKVWINPKTNITNYSNTIATDLQAEAQRIKDSLSRSYSPLIISSAIEFNNKLTLANDIAWNFTDNNIDSFEMTANYKFAKKYFVNLAYRYELRSNRLVKDTDNNQILLTNGSFKQANNNVNQLNLSLYFPITQKLSLIGGFKNDFTNNRVTDILTGLEYTNCCYNLRLILKQWLDVESNYDYPQQRYKVILQFFLYGLNKNYHNQSDITKIFQE